MDELTYDYYELLTKVIVEMLETRLDYSQSKEQEDFRGGYSTTNNVQIVSQVIERCNEYEIPLCLAFIDFEKAFDSIKSNTIFEAIQRQSIEELYTVLAKSPYPL